MKVFNDTSHKKGPLLVILVPGRIQSSGLWSSLLKWGCWGYWGPRGCWGCRGSKAWKIPTEDFRLIPVLELSLISMFLVKKIFGGIMKYQVGFKHLFCLRLLRSAYAIFLKMSCKYKNVITSGTYRTHHIYEIINPDTWQSKITLPISIWDTLYNWNNEKVCLLWKQKVDIKMCDSYLAIFFC